LGLIVLNVGGGGGRNVPDEYKGWSQQVLDIDPNVGAEVVLDAKLMRQLRPGQYDAVHCSHNLEHFYRHEVPQVLAGMLWVLKPDGHVTIVVPDMAALLAAVKDLDDVWYMAGDTPITYHDVMYGWGDMIAGGNVWYAHKCGFTPKSLYRALAAAGFSRIEVKMDGFNIHAKAFASANPDYQPR
jgi:predicted SAM-dependent methyltransferase